MPFGSYEMSNEQAVGNAIRLVKEGGADAVKLERGGTSVARARAIVDAGIAVMGHVGLTPQTATVLGGFKAQGRTANRAQQLVADALALQEAGCFAIVLEAVPAPVAARRRRLSACRRSASAPAATRTARCSFGTTCSATPRVTHRGS